mmetsp:Transcript_121008/g.353587  ORF Transcript_121008/g.353587 Transcript_121008/m.353587 type:complete len:418 (-) Transcript_121008:120-1373(-)
MLLHMSSKRAALAAVGAVVALGAMGAAASSGFLLHVVFLILGVVANLLCQVLSPTVNVKVANKVEEVEMRKPETKIVEQKPEVVEDKRPVSKAAQKKARKAMKRQAQERVPDPTEHAEVQRRAASQQAPEAEESGREEPERISAVIQSDHALQPLSPGAPPPEARPGARAAQRGKPHPPPQPEVPAEPPLAAGEPAAGNQEGPTVDLGPPPEEAPPPPPEKVEASRDDDWCRWLVNEETRKEDGETKKTVKVMEEANEEIEVEVGFQSDEEEEVLFEACDRWKEAAIRHLYYGEDNEVMRGELMVQMPQGEVWLPEGMQPPCFVVGPEGAMLPPHEPVLLLCMPVGCVPTEPMWPEQAPVLCGHEVPAPRLPSWDRDEEIAEEQDTCWAWAKMGWCPRGERCAWRHPELGEDPGPSN